MPSGNFRVAMLAHLETRETPSTSADLRFPTWLIVERQTSADAVLRISTTGVPASPEDGRAPDRLEPVETLLAQSVTGGTGDELEMSYELLEVPTRDMPFPGRFVPARGAVRLVAGARPSLKVAIELQGPGGNVEVRLVLLAAARPWVNAVGLHAGAGHATRAAPGAA